MHLRKHLLYLATVPWLTLNLFATPCNVPPTAAPVAVTVGVGTFQIVDVLAHTSDPDGQALSVSLESDTCPSHVSAVVDPAQTVRITALALSPDCQVRFRVSDGAGGIATSHVTVSVFDPTHIFSDGFELGTTAAWSRARH